MGRSEIETMIKGAFKVPKNVFDEKKMKFARIAHVKADFLDNRGNFWMGKGNILEGTG
jgi:hypothetical protein